MTKIAKCDEFKLLRAKTWHVQLKHSPRLYPVMLHGPYLKDRRDSYAHSTHKGGGLPSYTGWAAALTFNTVSSSPHKTGG